MNAISGERNDLHIIDAAICIDCGACGRVCPDSAVKDPEGVVCKMVKRSQWPKPVIEEDQCISCGVCLQACPTGVLDFRTGSDHQVHAVAWLKDPSNCIACGFCEAACPVNAISMKEPVPDFA
ncbi:MAG: 4Fe-4S binding protein [Anaerolineaceae bacterium]|nr:4Fe-4S binding protein [Anaerolineaceae bacterium]